MNPNANLTFAERQKLLRADRGLELRSRYCAKRVRGTTADEKPAMQLIVNDWDGLALTLREPPDPNFNSGGAEFGSVVLPELAEAIFEEHDAEKAWELIVLVLRAVLPR